MSVDEALAMAGELDNMNYITRVDECILALAAEVRRLRLEVSRLSATIIPPSEPSPWLRT